MVYEKVKKERIFFLYYIDSKVSVHVIKGWGCGIMTLYDLNLGTILR